ncbi:hypothetical protein GQ457_07G025360 [Hibiscus cannabinus]
MGFSRLHIHYSTPPFPFPLVWIPRSEATTNLFAEFAFHGIRQKILFTFPNAQILKGIWFQILPTFSLLNLLLCGTGKACRVFVFGSNDPCVNKHLNFLTQDRGGDRVKKKTTHDSQATLNGNQTSTAKHIVKVSSAMMVNNSIKGMGFCLFARLCCADDHGGCFQSCAIMSALLFFMWRVGLGVNHHFSDNLPLPQFMQGNNNTD